MAHALEPHFGESQGWHDFLGSLPIVSAVNYRIPVKTDPNIIINHIKESHLILARPRPHWCDTHRWNVWGLV